MFRRFWLLLVVLSAVTSLTGCLGAKHAWRAEPVVTEEVRVLPLEAYRRKNRLFVRVTLFNLTKVPLIVSRDSVRAQLDTGTVLDRSVGITSLHKPYTVQPGAAQRIDIDFRNDAILMAGAANVFWTGAVFDGARQLMIPATPVRVNGL